MQCFLINYCRLQKTPKEGWKIYSITLTSDNCDLQTQQSKTLRYDITNRVFLESPTIDQYLYFMALFSVQWGTHVYAIEMNNKQPMQSGTWFIIWMWTQPWRQSIHLCVERNMYTCTISRQGKPTLQRNEGYGDLSWTREGFYAAPKSRFYILLLW